MIAPPKRRTRLWILTLAACGLLGACSDGGKPTSLPRAQAWFDSHQAELNKIAALIDACRPIRSDTYFTRLFTDQDNGRALCHQGDQANFGKLMDALKASGLNSADYLLDANGHLVSIDLAVHYAQLGSPAPSTSFYYFAAPKDEPTPAKDDTAYHDPSRAMTAAPHHWFWRQG
ncbi:MAG: hypothetical protein JWM33_3304 [Caulobacteraceae bacterium]|nr:hypothetical protein [Caulobacteraceae bacterium]